MTRRDTPRIFISYAVSDGKSFADQLRRDLEKQNLSLWQDLMELEGGSDWWSEIEKAIRGAEFLVLVMTPGALYDPKKTVYKEWRFARREGTFVVPVMGSSGLAVEELPDWAKSKHLVHYDTPEQREVLYQMLRGPAPPIARVKFMPPDMDVEFVSRPDLSEKIAAQLLDGLNTPIALTGAGGFGKTALAAALCYDEQTLETFYDGILWLTLGKDPGDLIEAIRDLIRMLSDESPGFERVETAAVRLAELLAERKVLLLLDDVWSATHLAPFLRGGTRCVRLVTTRNSDVLPRSARKITVDAMTTSEAATLLSRGLRETAPAALRSLATRLGEWPLLLMLVNGVLRRRIELGQNLDASLDYVNRVLDKRALTGFDRHSVEARQLAVAATLNASLDQFTSDEQERFAELAIFPEDTDIPFPAVTQLWAVAAGFDEIDSDDLCQKLYRYSLLLKLDLGAGFLRLHDVVRAYLLHDRFAATAIGTLILSSDAVESDQALSLIQKAFRLSAHALIKNKSELTGQLLGRLRAVENQSVHRFLEKLVQHQKRPWLEPLYASLSSPGGALLQSVKAHQGPVLAVAISPGGRHIISASNDRTIKLWSLVSGDLIRSFAKQDAPITAIAITPDGEKIVAAADKTLTIWNTGSATQPLTLSVRQRPIKALTLTSNGKHVVFIDSARTLVLWDLNSGTPVFERRLSDHKGVVSALAITPDDQRILTASYDETLKLWDLASGELIRTFTGHQGRIKAVAITADGRRAVSAGIDKTLRVWDLNRSSPLRVLTGHKKSVNTVAITPDGKRAVSGSIDKTLMLWDLESGESTRTLRGHTTAVNSVVLSPDVGRAVSAANGKVLNIWDLNAIAESTTADSLNYRINDLAVLADGQRAVAALVNKTLVVWDIATKKPVNVFAGHTASVNALALSADGEFALSASTDKTLKLWDLTSGIKRLTLAGHNGAVRAIAIFDNDQRAASVSDDGSLRIWNLTTAECLQAIPTHAAKTSAVAVSADNHRIMTGADDNTIKLWDLASGKPLQTLSGHQGKISALHPLRDGRRILSCADDYTIRLWDMETGTVLKTIEGHSGPVYSLAVARNEAWVASVAKDAALKVWDLEGNFIAGFTADVGLSSCALGADNASLLAGDIGGRLHCLRLHNP